MLDRCSVSIGGIVEIKSDPFDRTEEFRKCHDFPFLTTKHTDCGKKGREARIFSPLQDDIVVGVVASEGNRHFLRGLQFNLNKLQYGHNHGGEFSIEAFAELQAVIRPFLVNPRDVEAIIPGLPDSMAWWQKMEIFCNYYDPSGQIKAAYQNCSHPSIRAIPRLGKGHTRELCGADLKCNFYDKTKESERRLLKWDVTESILPIQRIEFTLRRKKLIHYFSVIAASDPSIIITEDKLRSFKFPALAQVHTMILSELEGFFGTVGLNDCVATNHARFIAHLALSGEDADSLVDQWLAVNPPKNPKDRNPRSRLKKDVRKLLAEASPIDFADTFSPESYLQQPSIPVPKLELITRCGWRRTSIDPQILAVYGTARSFIPPSNS